MSDSNKLILFEAMILRSLFKIISRSTPMLKAKWKSTPMHPNRLFTFKFFMHNNSFLRINMLTFKQLPGLISPNGQYAKIHLSKLLPNFLKNITISRITCIEYFLPFRRFDYKATPQPLSNIH